MANEPERPIERLLRAAAEKRRQDAGPPLELHPADRRLLQAEVARQFAKAEAQTHPTLPLLVRFWRRLAWAVAILAVLFVAAALLLPGPGRRNKEMLLAEQEMRLSEKKLSREPAPSSTVEAIATQPPATAPAAVPPTRVELPEPTKDGFAVASLDQAAAPSGIPEPANRRRAAETLATTAATPPAPSSAAVVASGSAALYPAPASPAPVVGTTLAARKVAAADAETSRNLGQSAQSELMYRSLAATASGDANVTHRTAPEKFGLADAGVASPAQPLQLVQRYKQAVRLAEPYFADKAKPGQPVLSSFQVELAGRGLRIIDADGSVYSGQVQLAKLAGGLRMAKEPAPAAAPSSAPLGGALADKGVAGLDLNQLALQKYSFRVAGTNRTLRKKVVFTGSLLAGTTNLVVSRQAGSNDAIAKALAASNGWPTLLLRESHITGEAVVGSNKAIQVDALPTRP